MRDVNLQLGGLLLDMAAVAGSSQRGFGYKRAAKAVLRLDRHITPLVEANTVRSISGVGPPTDRIARELVLDGTSAFVEGAIDAAGKRDVIEKTRGFRAHFLSRAAVADVLSRAGITDHSYGLAIAGGMSMTQVTDQHAAIDQISARLKGTFRMFTGIDTNIRTDGTVDMEEHELRRFEFEVAARRQVAIEIDGSWDRQDVHYELAAAALERGCLFALDSDAHSHPELDVIDIAIAHARLAGIPQERIVNYWSEKSSWSGPAAVGTARTASLTMPQTTPSRSKVR